MTLIEIAKKRERRSDPILRFAAAAIELEAAMADLQNEIKSFTKIELGDDGVPVVVGFSDESQVISLQQQLDEVRSQRDELLQIISDVESVFENHGRQPCSMETVDDRIRELGEIGRDMQRKINALVIDLIQNNRAITLPEIWSHPDVRELEDQRARSIRDAAEELQALQALKNDLAPHLKDEGELCAHAFYPYRFWTKNPARISEMRSA
jgi:DNA repair ATPase RecN